MMLSLMADLPHSDFCIEIDYAKNSPNPSRVFRAMSDLIEALQSVDSTLAESLAIRLEPVLLLEDIEAGSIKAWLAQKIENVDDDALKSGDYKKVIGSYLVKGKYAVVDFLNKKTEIKSGTDIEPLEKELLSLAERTDIKQLLPIYQPVSRQKLLNDVNKISSALEPLTDSDKVSFIDADGRKTGFNLTLSIAPETIDELLTREAITYRADMILKVKRPDFLGDSKWEFRYDRKPFIAKVADQEWLFRYRNSEIPLNPGDALKAHVETTVRYGHEGDVVSIQHTILRIIEIIKPQPLLEQPSIDGLTE
jgi:hypothetical protein